MANEKQRTLAGEAVFTGKGLHSGEEATVKVLPAPVDAGLRIRIGGVEEKLGPFMSDGSRNCNCVSAGGKQAMTVEHLLSALWGMGIDNAVVDMGGIEVPGMDGSAADFVAGINQAGIVEQEAERNIYIPKDAVSVGDAGSGVTAYPSPDGKLRVTYILDYPESPLARGTMTLEITPETYANELANARTFVMRQHVEPMLAAGLGKGANPQNTVVLDGDQVVEGELRRPDECLRHKILDLVGDISIFNRRIGAHIVASKSGHALNIELAKALSKQALKVENPNGVIDFKEITALLPHRYPFLLVDRVLELEEGKRVVAMKNLTFNEPFFQGHFPGQPIMPGVLQVEALAQAGAIMMLGEFKGKGKLAVLMTADDVKWRRQVVPGDCLHLHAEFIKMKRNIGVAKAWATVEGETTCEGFIKFAIIDSTPAY
ncbi:MAG: 3-hydroxyacyl-ACP dehydratase FabZ [Planctomycetes bacterium]|nr:3-hydroxyacyl-ACP dehydratase FabZ [Planctomycetota bacterium]